MNASFAMIETAETQAKRIKDNAVEIIEKIRQKEKERGTREDEKRKE